MKNIKYVAYKEKKYYVSYFCIDGGYKELNENIIPAKSKKRVNLKLQTVNFVTAD